METESNPLFSLAFEFIDLFYSQLVDLTSAFKNVESLLGKNSIKHGNSKMMPFLKSSEDLTKSYNNLKNLLLTTLQKSQKVSEKNPAQQNKLNLRYETSNETAKENFNVDANYQSSLNKIKESFQINALNKSNSNRLGLQIKSNKIETPEIIHNISPTKPKIKPGSLNENINLEKILADRPNNKMHAITNFSCSFDSTRLKKFEYNPSREQEQCDPRLLDIINLNKRKSEVVSENNLDISENLTENMIEVVNKLSPKEEKEIVKETLRKEYKCEYTQLTDSKRKIFIPKSKIII